MSKTEIEIAEDQLKVEQWLAIRKEAGSTIEPETAEVMWCYAQTLDPYGVDPDLPEECYQVGREYFARFPDSDIWVWFGDLPDEVEDRLWKMHRSKLAFPAGLCGEARPSARITALECQSPVTETARKAARG